MAGAKTIFRRTALLSIGALIAALAGTAAYAQPDAPPANGAGSGSNTELTGSFNMRVIAHNDLGGGDLAKGGEGYAEVIAPNGHRILYDANESGPVCFNVLDVTDPAHPVLLSRTYVPNNNVRCNSLAANDSTHVMVVANQVSSPGETPAGIQVFSIADPYHPQQVSYLSTAGQYSTGVHAVWLQGDYVYMSSGVPDAGPWGPAFVPRSPDDNQIEVIASVQDPAHPKLVGEWWYPGTRAGDPQPLPPAARDNAGCRAHNTQVYPPGNVAYVAYIDCGIVVLNVSDKAHPKVIAMYRDDPPNPGFTHTVMPVDGGRYLAVTHEATADNCADFPKVITFVNSQTLQPVSYTPLPANQVPLCDATGRSGSHNISENVPDGPNFRSDSLVIGSFFNAGVRIFDVSNPAQPRLVAWDIPPAPDHPSANAPSPDSTIQINDVFVDNRGVIFADDRFGGGLYVLKSPVIDTALQASTARSGS